MEPSGFQKTSLPFWPRNVYAYRDHTIPPSQFSKVTSWLSEKQIPLCANQHSNSIPLSPTLQFSFSQNINFRERARVHTPQSFLSSPFTVQDLCFDIWKNLLTWPHLRSPGSGAMHRRNHLNILLWMGLFCPQLLNQIPQKLDIIFCLKMLLVFQEHKKVLNNLEMTTEVETIFLAARDNNQTHKTVTRPFSLLQHFKPSTGLLWRDA